LPFPSQHHEQTQPIAFGLKQPKPKKKAATLPEAARELFRPFDLALLEIVSEQTGVQAEWIIKNALSCALCAWISYEMDDRTGECTIAADDLPSEPDLQRHVEARYHEAISKPRNK
jgi:hypothetical protein